MPRPRYNDYAKNYGLVCRGGIYAARCSRPGKSNYRVNRTGRIYASPTNLPKTGIFPYDRLPSGCL